MRLKVSNVCQLVPKFNRTDTDRGVTFTYSGDGSCTINGTPTGEYYSLSTITLDIKSIKPNHKYLIYEINNEPIISELILANYTGGYIFRGIGDIYTFPEHDYTRFVFEIRVNLNQTANNIVVKPQLFDLTEMYGAGNEPTTVAQFRQDFPNEMYEYSPVCWKKFRRLKYIANKQPVQLLDKSKFPATLTENGVTFTNNGDGTITANGTSTKNYAHYFIIVPRPAIGHKILVLPENNNKTQDHIYVWAGSSNLNSSWVDDLGYGGNIITITGIGNTLKNPYTRIGININVNKDWVMNNHIYKPQFFDLTEMYGAGNEPTTVEQFRADYPNELYDYNLYNYLTLNRGKYIANKEPVQLLDKSKYPATGTSNGITYTKNEDGSYDVNGTIANTGLSACLIGTAEMVAGHIYLNNAVVVSGQKYYVECKYWNRDLQRWVFPGSRFQCGNYSAYAQITLLVNQTAGTVISNGKLYPELFDLTEMYGAGNEPTEEEFWSTHSKTTMYDYNPYNAITFR